MTTTRGIPAACALALLFVLACSDSVAPKAPAQHLIAVEGSGQTGATLDTLPEWLVVRVVDDGGAPMPGVPITWSSDDETGRIIPVDPVTTGDGIARGLAVLGFTDGAQRFHARAEEFDDAATFELTAVRGPVLKAVSLMNASGSDHMCALDVEGRAWCWGQNSWGQLGNGTTDRSEVARPVLTSQRFSRIAASYSTTCAIALDQSLWCWGYNGDAASGEGLYGNGTTDASPVPVPGAAGLSVADIDFDGRTACVVTTEGEAWCWGRIITPEGNSSSMLPVKVESSERWRDISVSGSDRVCAVSRNYVAHCWATGLSTAQRAGLEGEALAPRPVPGIPPVVEVTVGWWNQCGRLASGSGVVCWGESFLNGAASTARIQYPRLEGSGFARVGARAETLMALGTDGGLHIWGFKPQCCDGFISVTPAPLARSESWIDFAMGTGAYGILASDSTVHYWYPFPDGPPSRAVPQPVRVEE